VGNIKANGVAECPGGIAWRAFGFIELDEETGFFEGLFAAGFLFRFFLVFEDAAGGLEVLNLFQIALQFAVDTHLLGGQQFEAFGVGDKGAGGGEGSVDFGVFDLVIVFLKRTCEDKNIPTRGCFSLPTHRGDKA
jgi:hypothetical protein